MAIKIIIDSASDIGVEEGKALGVTVIPLTVLFGEEEFQDGVNLLPKDFFEKLESAPDLPKTSQITAYTFEEEFQKVVNNGDEGLVITLSSKLSGTYNSAVTASKKFNGKIRVVDSMAATVSERLVCEYARTLVADGLTLDEVADVLDRAKGRIRLSGVLDTFKYVKRGGRISSAAALVGSALSIKPVLKLVDGEIKTIAKALGMRKAINHINDYLAESKGIDFNLPHAFAWSGLDKGVLTRYLENSADVWGENINDLPAYPIGATIGTHVGPGVFALAYFEKE